MKGRDDLLNLGFGVILSVFTQENTPKKATLTRLGGRGGGLHVVVT